MSATEPVKNADRTYPKKKSSDIEEIIEYINSYDAIGITNLDGITSSAIQGIRRILYKDFDKTVIKVSKNTLKRIAFSKAKKKGLDKLEKELDGSCGLVFSNANPFKLQRFLGENQVEAPAKPGMTATREVVIPAGPTDLNPGPVIGELNSIGARASVQKGKINIMNDATVLKEGDIVTETHASVLNRLRIKPFKIGLSIQVALENGELIKSKDLVVDEEKIMGELFLGYQNALSLSMYTGYPTKETIEQLLQKAYREAMNLSVEKGFPTKENLELLLSKVAGTASGFAKKIGYDSS
ncbi:MAG: 50S ribosomal protein L10 [Candidatus Hodarchaeales archaeon]|jgi:large subunit ribosomal protein L10